MSKTQSTVTKPITSTTSTPRISRTPTALALLLTAALSLGPRPGHAQSTADTPTSPAKNHIEDTERDRLLKEAMEKARRELEAQKAKQAADEKKAADQAQKKQETAEAAEAAQARLENQKVDTAADAARKAEEERLAKKLADEANNPGKATQSLQPLPQETTTVNLDTEKKATTPNTYIPAAPKTTAKSETKSDTSEKVKITEAKAASKSDDKKTADAKKPSSADTKKSDSTSEKSDAKTEAKTVVETIPTKEPGSSLTVKASASETRKVSTSAGPKDSEKDVNFRPGEVARGGDEPDSPSSSSEGDSTTIQGQVVGMMRGTGMTPRILVRESNGRMVQVLLDKGETDIPAPTSQVSIHGRTIGGAGSMRVISASSVSIKSGQKLATRPEVPGHAEAPGRNNDDEDDAQANIPQPYIPGQPLAAGPIGPAPMIGGPMIGPPLGLGGPMLPPPPPF